MRRAAPRTSKIIWKSLILISLVSTAIVTTFWATTVSGDPNQRGQTPGINLAPWSERPSAPTPTAKWSYSTQMAGAHVAADVNGDSQLEIIVSCSHDTRCLSGTGGVKWISHSAGYEHMMPAVADVDGDGMQEIVTVEFIDYKLCCLSSTGGLKWKDPTQDWFTHTSPVIADIDGDSKLEIITGCEKVGGAVSLSPKVYCFTGTGGVKWSYLTGGHNSIVVGDVDLDGKLEIVAGSSGELYCLNGSGGLVWSFPTSGDFSTPIITDIDQDGKQEVLVGSSDHTVCCLNGSGSPKWIYETLHPVWDVTSADIDLDGSLELIVRSTDFSSYNSALYCLTGFGALKWRYTPGYTFSTPPAVGDVDGDTQPEIVIGTLGDLPSSPYARDYALYCLNGSGTLEWKYPVTSDIYNQAEIADVDGDSRPEIIVTVLFAGKVYCLSTFASPLLELSAVPFVVGGLVGAAMVAIAADAARRRKDRVRTRVL